MRISGQPMQSSYMTEYFTLKEITEKCDNHECVKFQLLWFAQTTGPQPINCSAPDAERSEWNISVCWSMQR